MLSFSLKSLELSPEKNLKLFFYFLQEIKENIFLSYVIILEKNVRA